MAGKKSRDLDEIMIELGEACTTLKRAERTAETARETRLSLWIAATNATPRSTHKTLAEASGVTESYVTQQLRKAGVRSR